MKKLSHWLQDAENRHLGFLLMSHLSSGLCHELNNIMTSLMGNISLTKMFLHKDPQKAEAKLEEAEKALLRARTLLDRIHHTSTKKEQPKTLLPIILITKSEINLFNSTRINFLYQEDEKIKVPLAEDAFRYALRNGIANALEAAADDAAKITIQLELLADCCQITISNRETIAASDLDQIFLPYYSTKDKNSGLGLTIIEAAMQLHGGQMQLTSAAETGTILTLRFPLTM